jgi:hypothetical protein
MLEETDLSERPRVAKQGFLWSIWAWCCGHRFVLILLAIIFFQQCLLALALWELKKVRERYNDVYKQLQQMQGLLTPDGTLGWD